MKRLLTLAPLIIAAVFPFVCVQACGPFFFDDVFVRPLRPDHPKLFAQGKLGILLPTYPRADLAVAYRYLNAGTLTPEEQKAYKPTPSLSEIENEGATDDAELGRTSAASAADSPSPADLWLKARDQYAQPQSDVHEIREKFGSHYSAGDVLAHAYYICQADAFSTALTTLQSRAKTWGPKSAELADWIKAQDAVFSNCAGDTPQYYWGPKSDLHASLPAPAPENAPRLLRQDRAYQIAAAQFYSSKWPQAQAAFQAIAEDKDSPWRGIAAYLVARCFIREAYLTAQSGNGPDDNAATFDPKLMHQAQQQLESLRDRSLPAISPHAIQQMMNLVRLRTEPEARLREISAALAGPKADPNYAQDLEDLTWYLNGKLDSLAIREDSDDFKFNIQRPQNDYTPLSFAQKQPGFEKAFDDVASLRAVSPLVDWLISVQSPSDKAKEHAFSEWKRSHSTPWLVAALIKAKAAAPELPELLEAAHQLPSTSPAWPTVSYYRIKLLLDSGHIAAARSELASAFPVIQTLGSESALNLFTGLRMRSAAKLDEALADAPRQILDRVSVEQSSIGECLYVMKDPKRKYECKDPKSAVEFSGDSTTLLNKQMPLAELTHTAQSSTLPNSLRQSVAIMTWARAVLLKNDTIAAQMLPLLPSKLQEQAGSGTGFHPLMAILRNPGLRPYLDAGVQRSYSWDFVENYADNWWCADWSTNNEAPQIPSGSVASLTPQMRIAASQDLKHLTALGSADEYLGSAVLAYAKAHPNDPDVPESLYLTLRMVRYGCYHGYTIYGHAPDEHAATPGNIAHEVVVLMRRRYIANPWTKKAAPFVYLGDSNEN